MKLLGIIGGTGPESTIDYYRLLLKVYKERKPDSDLLPVVINSVDAASKLKPLVDADDLPEAVSFLLVDSARSLSGRVLFNERRKLNVRLCHSDPVVA
jgi:aspartate/glutamate racemase